MAWLHDWPKMRDVLDKERVDMIFRGYSGLCLESYLGRLDGDIYIKDWHLNRKDALATVDSQGNINLNVSADADMYSWAYAIGHCLLHLAFGHFDRQNMPDAGNGINIRVWNKACDICVDRVLAEMELGLSLHPDIEETYGTQLTDEKAIYEQLLKLGDDGSGQEYGTNIDGEMDMIGLEHPLEYGEGESNRFTETYVREKEREKERIKRRRETIGR